MKLQTKKPSLLESHYKTKFKNIVKITVLVLTDLSFDDGKKFKRKLVKKFLLFEKVKAMALARVSGILEFHF